MDSFDRLTVACANEAKACGTVKIGTGFGTIPAGVFNRQYRCRALASPGEYIGGQEGRGREKGEGKSKNGSKSVEQGRRDQK